MKADDSSRLTEIIIPPKPRMNHKNVPLLSLDSKDTIRIGSAGTPVRISPPNGGLRIDNQVNRVGTRTATLRNAPTEGDPKFWLPINIGGTTRFVPCW